MIRLLLLTLIISNAYALTDRDVVEIVTSNFSLIEEALLKEESAKGEVTAMEGAFDHKVSFKSRNRIEDKYANNYFETTIERLTPYNGLALVAGHRQGYGTFPAYDGKYRTSTAGEIFAGLALPILRNFRTDAFRTNLVSAELERKKAQEEVRMKKNIYVHKALSLYYKYLLSNHMVKIRKEILKLAEIRQSMLDRRFKAGSVERIKLNDNLRSIDKRRDELAKARIELAKVGTELSLYIGDIQKVDDPYLSEKIIQREEPTFIPDFSSVPQLRMVDFERKKIEAFHKLYAQSRLPGLNLELIGARELSGNEPFDPERLQVGVKFDFPLENRKAEGKTVAAHYKIKALDKQKEYLLQEFTRLFDFSLSASKESRKRWKIVSRELSNTRIMADAEKKKWQQGASDLFIVNLREQDVADTEIRRWTTLYELKQYDLDARLFSGTITTL
jgi:outer membrane protein TolC